MMKFRIDRAEIHRALQLFLEAGQVTELRALNCIVDGERRSGTFSGYFDREHIDQLIVACEKIHSASGVYFIPNAVNPALLGRANNRARIVQNMDPTTSDHDILERRWLLIDVDAVRPAGISASASEKEAAERLVTAIDYHLWELGFPPGIIGDSGNGAHLMIPISLPADDKGKVKHILKGLAKEFNTAAATVDISVSNAARIWKLPGTLVCKGEHCPEIGREWRMAKITSICERMNYAM